MPYRMTFALLALFGLAIIVAAIIRPTAHPTAKCGIAVCAVSIAE